MPSISAVGRHYLRWKTRVSSFCKLVPLTSTLSDIPENVLAGLRLFFFSSCLEPESWEVIESV